MNLFSYMVFPLLFASGEKRFETQKINLSRFSHALVSRNVETAAKFVPLFDKSRDQIELEHLAQFYFMTCRPRRALQAIGLFQSEQRKELFQATLWSLVSVKRPNLSADKPKLKLTKAQTVTKVSDGEIWADEWADLSLDRSPCVQMQVFRKSESRMHYLEKAKVLFEKVPADEYLRDFNLVALALDCGARIPNPKMILAHFRSQSASPYYARLQSKTEPLPPQGAVRVSALKKNELALSEFVINDEFEVPHQIEVPLLIDELNL